MKTYEGTGGKAPPFSTSGLDEGEWSDSSTTASEKEAQVPIG
jgi:hypothetical protein